MTRLHLSISHTYRGALTSFFRALYLRGDLYERSDAVFGVKESLIVSLKTVSEVDGLAEKYGVSPSTKLMTYEFVLVSEKETSRLRDRLALETLQMQGAHHMDVIDGLLVPSLD